MTNKKPYVISVGNLSMGGTGKTPHTIAIAQYFIDKGEKVAILSRGYKGKIGLDTHVISDGENILLHPPYASDEPYMMANNIPQAVVITGKKRNQSLELAVEKYGVTLAILDDGFQHKTVKKDTDVVLLDYSNPISTGFPVPFGYLREFPSALKRADIIVFTRATDTVIPERVKKYIKDKPVFFSNIDYKHIIHGEKVIELSDINGRNVVAYSALANNKAFKASIEQLGANVVYYKSFTDHNMLSVNDIEHLTEQKEKLNATYILTTEKDYVKIPNEYKNLFSYVKIGIKIIGENKFYNILVR